MPEFKKMCFFHKRVGACQITSLKAKLKRKTKLKRKNQREKLKNKNKRTPVVWSPRVCVFNMVCGYRMCGFRLYF